MFLFKFLAAFCETKKFMQFSNEKIIVGHFIDLFLSNQEN